MDFENVYEKLRLIIRGGNRQTRTRVSSIMPGHPGAQKLLTLLFTHKESYRLFPTETIPMEKHGHGISPVIHDAMVEKK